MNLSKYYFNHEIIYRLPILHIHQGVIHFSFVFRFASCKDKIVFNTMIAFQQIEKQAFASAFFVDKKFQYCPLINHFNANARNISLYDFIRQQQSSSNSIETERKSNLTRQEFKNGDQCLYNGKDEVRIIEAYHGEDESAPFTYYYDIQMPEGNERRTTQEYLQHFDTQHSSSINSTITVPTSNYSHRQEFKDLPNIIYCKFFHPVPMMQLI